jgi:N-acetylmuramoyl-L-alanine amidase
VAFKIAYGAGHNNKTANGIPTELHSPKVNEWQLNDKVARYFSEAADQYEDVELLRVDDPQGVQPVDLAGRCITANNWDADFFLAIHHNGFQGVPWDGGGLVAFSYPGSTKGATYRDAICDACLAAGGLKGDRATHKATANFQVLRETHAPAVLMEYGFMDSRVDVPIILTDEYAKSMAYATMDGIANVAGLKKKTVNEIDVEYRVITKPVKNMADAILVKDKLASDGYDSFIVASKIYNEV